MKIHNFHKIKKDGRTDGRTDVRTDTRVFYKGGYGKLFFEDFDFPLNCDAIAVSVSITCP